MRIRLSRQMFGAVAAGGFAALAVSCVPAPERPPAPSPTPAPVRPAPVPQPTSAPVPTYSTWRDAPQTPGDWSYRTSAEGSGAYYGGVRTEADFSILCRRANRSIDLVRAGAATGAQQMVVRTSNGDREVVAQAESAGVPAVVASMAATDPLLDAVSYSRGRFSVEVPGMEPLFLPSWPEILRVIDDCR